MSTRLTGRALPEAAFLPGRGQREAPTFVPAENDLAFGIDLFHHGFLWEAHEVWERSWREARAGSATAHALRGLIQAAAAMLQGELGRPVGLASLAAKAELELAQGGTRLAAEGLVIDLVALRRDLASWVAAGAARAARPRISWAWAPPPA